MLICWLVVSNMILIFHNIWDVIFPIDELIFFKMVSQPPNFAGVFVWWTSNKSKKPATAGQEPFKLHVPDFLYWAWLLGLAPAPKMPGVLAVLVIIDVFFRRNLRWAKMFVVKIGGIRVSTALNLKEQLLCACVPANTLCCHVPAPLSSTVICAMCGATRNPAQDQLWRSKRHQGRFFGIQWNWENLQLWGDIPSGKLT